MLHELSNSRYIMTTFFIKKAFLVLGLISCIGRNLAGMNDVMQDQCTTLIFSQNSKKVIEDGVRDLNHLAVLVFENPDFFMLFVHVIIDNVNKKDIKSIFSGARLIMALAQINKSYYTAYQELLKQFSSVQNCAESFQEKLLCFFLEKVYGFNREIVCKLPLIKDEAFSFVNGRFVFDMIYSTNVVVLVCQICSDPVKEILNNQRVLFLYKTLPSFDEFCQNQLKDYIDQQDDLNILQKSLTQHSQNNRHLFFDYITSSSYASLSCEIINGLKKAFLYDQVGLKNALSIADDYGNTPLVNLCEKGLFKEVSSLICALKIAYAGNSAGLKAAFCQKTVTGAGALAIAINRRHDEVVQLLRSEIAVLNEQ